MSELFDLEAQSRKIGREQARRQRGPPQGLPGDYVIVEHYALPGQFSLDIKLLHARCASRQPLGRICPQLLGLLLP